MVEYRNRLSREKRWAQLDEDVDYHDEIEQYLSERRGSSVKILVPQKGEQKKIVDMAYQNALERLKRESGRKTKSEAALGELIQGIHSFCTSRGADFVTVRTDQPIEKALFKELLKVGITA